MEGGAKEEIIARFRTLLNDFKRPYLQQTDAPTKGKGDADQTLRALDDVFENIHRLFLLLKSVIEEGGHIPPSHEADPEKGAILAVFEKQGILPAIRSQPELKEPMIRYLILDLETYPYTLNPKHISVLAKHDIESHQSDIIDNKPDE